MTESLELQLIKRVIRPRQHTFCKFVFVVENKSIQIQHMDYLIE